MNQLNNTGAVNSDNKPPLISTNSLSNLFFNDIYQKHSLNNDKINTVPMISQQGSKLNSTFTPHNNLLASSFMNQSNSNVLSSMINDIKATPRCLTPLNGEINSFYFPTPSTTANEDMKNLQNSFNKNNANNNSDALYNALFNYPQKQLNLGDNVVDSNDVIINNHYTFNTPADSTVTLSPYQRNSITSTATTTTTSSFPDDSDNLDNINNEELLIINNNYKGEMGMNMNMNMNVDMNMNIDMGINDITFQPLDMLFKDRMMTNSNEVEVLNDEISDAQIQLQILLPSQQGLSNSNNTNQVNNEINDNDNKPSIINNLNHLESVDEANGLHYKDNTNEDNDNYRIKNNDPITVVGDGVDDLEDINASAIDDDESSDYEDTLYKRNVNKRKRQSITNNSRKKNNNNSNKKVKKNGVNNNKLDAKNNNSSNGNNKQFRCTQCTSSFTRKTRLTEHVNRVHLGKVYHFKCEQCGTRLSSKENLTRHSIVHTDKFKCKKCNRRFDRSYRYQRHLEKCSMV
jgi:hypothetical protein